MGFDLDHTLCRYNIGPMIRSVLNCPCHLYGSIYHRIGCTIEPPIVWYIQKCMLIWKICFYFSFVFAICSSKMKTRHVTRDRFTEKVLSRSDNFQLARSFHILGLGIGKEVLYASDENTDDLRNPQGARVSNYKDAEEREFSHSM